jgi:hypothetical protein
MEKHDFIEEGIQRIDRSKKYRCPPLTEAQQTQACHAFHCMKYGMNHFDDHVVDATLAAMLQYTLHNGTWVHLVTVYEKSNRFLGFGKRLRDPNKTENALDVSVRNRCRVVDGEVMGAGGPGCKGIVYVPKDGNIYDPRKQHKRILCDNMQMKNKSLMFKSL